ncbi:DNA polymerase II large subunit [Candidatus Woesearchaeota archaeon]|jgi:DNA polymerase II large subunit|nr:DNA polymerase II large subunit [Candidatus Woesearchaeota archaeon]MBT6367747.1 DNA polymerase II large subunit [Candidatus Woesearchaeota archaeon]MBT7762852.1 DNA polymerase II large subunit [Candidatus Woesearchaeota archaeon]
MASTISPDMQKYFAQINADVKRSYDIARKAKKKGLDIDDDVPIPVAKNMAERVVGLISVIAPQIVGTTIPQRIIELEKKYGTLDWRVALKISEEVAKQKFCEFKDKIEAMEIGIRIGFSYLTLGVVSAPLEGFIGLKIKKRKDGKEYFALQYAGPIRAAGGTGSSVSVILSDYVRMKMGYAPYDPEEVEVNRYAAEVHDYHDRVTNLQYHPSDEELKFLVSHLPVEVDGDPTEKFEVSNYKDLPRIETNRIRGGVALVLAEGLSQKSPKLWKKLSKWGKEFGLEWDWLKDFLELKEKIHANVSSDKDKKEDVNDGKKKVKPNNTFIMDLVAGRPIFTHPLAVGGFRLRYGRGRTCGMYAVGIHPATMVVLNDFIAVGTQLKVERPRKGASATVCDTIEGPTVRLIDGTVLRLDSAEDAKNVKKDIETILFLGDIMFNYGDFAESGHDLVPVGYCPEWWILEVEKAMKNLFNEKHVQKSAEKLGVKESEIQILFDNPLHKIPPWSLAKQISEQFHVPLHPEYTYYWNLISGEDLIVLKEWMMEGKIKVHEEKVIKIIFPYTQKNELYMQGKKILEECGISHKVITKENIILEKKEAEVIAFLFDFKDQKGLEKISLKSETIKNKTALEVLNFVNNVTIRDKAGTFIGARMGRPEKAKMRQMTGSPQMMFPVGEEGDRLRSVQSALKAGKIRSIFPLFYCSPCDKDMIYPRCEECGKECTQKYFCRFCGDVDKETCRHGDTNTFKTQDIDIAYYLDRAKKKLGEKIHPDLIKGVRGTSNKDHLVEHLAKGILRAKHNVYVNKDGTIRYDATELPLTHFKPKEIHTSVEKLRELGYEKDIKGNLIENDTQIIELKPQDVVLSGFNSLEESASIVLTRIANFIDNLLVSFYGLKPFYNITKTQDLVGHLVIGLAPHISAGIVGRIVGFSETQSLIAHPMYHAAMRRDCDGDESCVMMLMDALLNFSRQYLPERRGAKTMDAPLVLTSTINPAEVDDQVLEMDTVWKYPLELFEAALEMKKPWDVVDSNNKKIDQLSKHIGTPLQYEGFGFTHDVDNFNMGVLCSAYKTLPSMAEKLVGQMEIAKIVRAVDMDDVAKLVIQKHFLKDIKGNLRKFSMQQFRCGKCNTKYRRPPLNSKCSECGNKLMFTISEGSVVKYLGPSLMLAEKYDFSPYLKQTLDILKDNVDTIFGKEKDKQVGLGSFMG